MVRLSIARFVVVCESNGAPACYDHYKRHAMLAHEYGIGDHEGAPWFVGVGHGNGWPILTAMGTSRASSVFNLCVAIVPETEMLFIGAGERLLAYRLDVPELLWEDRTEFGAWSWHRHGDVMVLSAELELAAWSLEGEKLWSTFVEPPWDYTVDGDTLHLDVMERKSSFSLHTGPLQHAAVLPA